MSPVGGRQMHLMAGLQKMTTVCTSFFKSNGVGVIQVSAYRNEKEKLPDEDLEDFMGEEISRATPISLNEFLGFQVSYSEDGKHWRKWWLMKGSLLLFVTYNCDHIDRDLESDEVNRLLSSLHPKV